MTGTPPRDWDKELAEIDRLLQKGPAPAPAPAPVAKPGGPPARPGTAKGSAPAPGAAVSRGSVGGVWLRVGLGVLFAAAVTQWPYAAACGLGLFLYLGVVGMVLVTGLWGAVTAWRRRMGLAHILSLGVIAAGVVFLVSEVLPRTGYARQSLGWFCG